MWLLFAFNIQAQNESVIQLNRYVGCCNDLIIELNLFYEDFLRFKIDYANYLKNDNTFKGFREPKKPVYLYTIKKEMLDAIEKNNNCVTQAEHNKVLAELKKIEGELGKIYLTHKYLIEYYSENNNKVKIEKSKPIKLIEEAADCFDNVYVAKEEIRNLLVSTYKNKYYKKHISSDINRLQQLSERSTTLAHKIQFNLRNNDTTEHRKLTIQLSAINDTLLANKALFTKAVYSNIKWVNENFEKNYAQFCWTIKRFCNFSEDLRNNDKFLNGEVNFYNNLGEPLFPSKYNVCDTEHNFLLIAQLCDNELISHQVWLYNFFDISYLNSKVRYKNYYNSKHYKKEFDSLKLDIIDSTNTTIFLRAVKEPYVFRGKKKLSKIEYKNVELDNVNNSEKKNENKTKNGSVNQELNFNEISVGETIQLKNVLFELSKDVLLEGSYPTLIKLSTFLKENPTTVILLSGHTDYVGNSKANKKLSKQRVKKVKKYLLSKDVLSKQIKLKWFGGSQPLVKSNNEETRAINRRVEASIIKK